MRVAGGGGDHREGRVKEGEGQETARLEMVGGSKKRHGCFAKPSG